jgi:adenylyltransferase/sulfurtransferase
VSEAHITTPIGESRDSSLRLIDWFDSDRVRAANTLVVGAGAIGNEVLKNLAMLGVGNIFVFDKDVVEISNLTRSILFSPSDVNQPKALVASRAVKRINPEVVARWNSGDILCDLGLGVVRRMDVIVAGLDNVRARLRLNEMCLRVGRPWIEAGIGVLNGDVCVYLPDRGACYECYTQPESLDFGLACNRLASRYESEGRVPTTPTIASIIGGVQAQEALKLLHPETWEGRTLASRRFVFNGTSVETLMVNLTRRADCPQHGARLTPLVEARDLSAAGTTVGDLIGRATELLGSEPTLELNFVLALGLECECDSPDAIMRPLDKLYAEDLSCEKCGFRPTHAAAVSLTEKINRRVLEEYPTLRDYALADIGVPPLDIVRASGSRRQRLAEGEGGGSDSWTYVLSAVDIELTGDERRDLHFSEA